MSQNVEAQLEEVLQQLYEAEAQGVEMVALYEEKIRAKDAEIAELHAQASPSEPVECESCDDLRVSLAMVWTGVILYLWYTVIAGNPELPDRRKAEGFLCVVAPWICLMLGNRWRRFKRAHVWKGVFDNDIYRTLRARWNRSVEAIKWR